MAAIKGPWQYVAEAVWLSAPGSLRNWRIVQLSKIQLIWRSWRMAASRSVTLWDGIFWIPWSFWHALSSSLVAASTSLVVTYRVNWVIDFARRLLTAASSLHLALQMRCSSIDASGVWQLQGQRSSGMGRLGYLEASDMPCRAVWQRHQLRL